jgi:NAD(P) transhydrogenase subunit alpha
MKLGIPKETIAGEKRVAATPKTIARFQKQGFEVLVEKDAGVYANHSNQDYLNAGATVLDTKEVYAQADIILKVLAPQLEEVDHFHEGQFLVSYIVPDENQSVLEKLAAKKVSVVAMDYIPRISRAQKMDVLSSMANIAGYRAVIEAANHYGHFLNGQITAAGKVDPAKVLVIGAGVAGLAAIGAARNLGAIVKAFDTRKAVEEQIQSMGAQFLTVDIEEDGATSSGYSKQMSQAFIDAEMALFREQAKEVDIVITTALIPGRPAPKLWLKDMVEVMKPGSVIIDLAYPRGGNCELTKPGEIYTSENGVTIVGQLDQMPAQASQLYSSNLAHLLDDMGKADGFNINLEDDVIKGSLIVHNGKVNWPLPQISVAVSAPAKKEAVKQAQAKPEPKKPSFMTTLVTLGLIAAGLGALGMVAPPAFLGHFTVFVLSVFVGWQVIWNVSHSLHTPLMSVTNAISGIILIGGILNVEADLSVSSILALVAVFVASINIFGGFMVTHRMLKMFQRS